MDDDILAPYGGFTDESLAVLNLRPADVAEVFKEENEHTLKALIEDLEELRLGIYTTDLGQFLIGVQEPSLHIHERWVYMRLETAQTWHHIQHHLGGLSTAFLLPGRVGGVKLNVQKKIHKTGISHDAAVLAHWRDSPYVYTNLFEEIQRVREHVNLSPSELHELIFDVALWREHHPEFTDMPGDLIWRMYGLHTAVEIAQYNRARGEDDEEAFL
jgi:hypothetical protein